MSSRLIALIAVIIVFGALTAQALLDVGYFGIFEIQIQTWSGMQVFTDLAIMCVLAVIWMVRDAKTSGVNAWPFVVMTLVAGAFGPLFYLVARELKAGATQTA